MPATKTISKIHTTARASSPLVSVVTKVRGFFRLDNKALLAAVAASVILGLIIFSISATAATADLIVNEDVSVTGWGAGGTPDTTCAGGTLCDRVDEYAGKNTDYIETTTTNGSETVVFGLDTVPSVLTATQLSVQMYAKAAVVGQTLVDNLSVNLIVNGTPQTVGACNPGNLTWASCTINFSGSWTQADVDTMQIQIVRNIQGSKGSTASRADTTQVSWVMGTLTYTPSKQLTQSAYRFYEPTSTTDVGAPLAAQDTAVNLPSNDSFRLRMNVGVSGATLEPSYRWKAVSVGDGFACGIGLDDKAYCWGLNDYGQLGDGNLGVDTNVPVPVDTNGVLAGKTIKSISSGSYHVCAIASDDNVYCWGDNYFSQLGDGSAASQSDVPVTISTSGALAGKTIKQVDSGVKTVCAVASDDQAYCWGNNSNGQLGNGNTGTSSNVPVAVTTTGALSGSTIRSIAVGSNHACAIASDDLLYCWGANGFGQLGNSNPGVDSNVPVAVTTSGVLYGLTANKIALGNNFTCLIGSDNKPYCWGYNANGQLGIAATGGQTDSPAAVDISGVLAGEVVRNIDLGDSHACVTTLDELPYCWGYNLYGQLGDGNGGINSNVPVAVDMSGVMSGLDINSISAGSYTTCAKSVSYYAFCWGYNNTGELGNGNTGTDSAVPVSVDVGFEGFRLQYKKKVGDTCDIAGTYNDVTTATPIRYSNYAYIEDGAAMTPNANDPTTGTPTVTQTVVNYNGNITVKSAIPSGSEGVWDFALSARDAEPLTSYCLKLVLESGADIDGYDVVPELFTAEPYTFAQSSYRLFENTDSTSVGSPLSAQDTAATISVGTAFRLRQILDLRTGNNSNDVGFKLQAGEKISTCDATSYTDMTGLGFHDNPSVNDGVYLSESGSDPVSANGDVIAQSYKENGNFTLIEWLYAGDSPMWDFSLMSDQSLAGKTYCFRTVYADGSLLSSYDYYPEITFTANSGGGGGEPSLNQQLRGGHSVIDGVKSPFSW